MNSKINQYQTTTGHSFSAKDWLDLHFRAVENEYNLMVQSTGIQEGSRILDAGCGNGCFIHKLSELTGENGAVVAIDMAPENIKSVKDKLQGGSFQGGVLPVRGNVLTLPYKNDVFDGVWCSAVTQYLSNEELQTTLTEFVRVVRPGGFVAVKEFDGTLFYFSPFAPTLFWRSADLMDEQKKTNFLSRPIQMKSLLATAGLIDLNQNTYLIEKRHPLNEIETKYISTFFAAEDVSWVTLDTIPEDDRKHWKSISDPTSPNYILKNKDFYWREGHIVSIGFVPRK